MKKEWLINDQTVNFEIIEQTQDALVLKLEDQIYRFSKRSENVIVDENGKRVPFLSLDDLILVDGLEFHIATKKKGRAGQGASQDKGNMRSPMPGKILKVFVQKGDRVQKGDALLVLEAMKMEHTIKAPCDGVIEKLPFATGDQVQAQVELIELKPDEEE